MNVTRVAHLQAVLYCFKAEVQVVVLYLQSLLQVVECTAEFLCAAEDAREVVVGYRTEPIRVLCQILCLPQELQCNAEVIYMRLFIL